MSARKSLILPKVNPDDYVRNATNELTEIRADKNFEDWCANKVKVHKIDDINEISTGITVFALLLGMITFGLSFIKPSGNAADVIAIKNITHIILIITLCIFVLSIIATIVSHIIYAHYKQKYADMSDKIKNFYEKWCIADSYRYNNVNYMKEVKVDSLNYWLEEFFKAILILRKWAELDDAEFTIKKERDYITLNVYINGEWFDSLNLRQSWYGYDEVGDFDTLTKTPDVFDFSFLDRVYENKEYN